MLLLLFTTTLSSNARQTAQTLDFGAIEYQLKAALIYNFARFIEWPDQVAPGDAFIICVLGQDPFGLALEALQRKTVKDKPIQIKRFPTLDELERCHILFVSASESDNLPAIFGAVSGDSVLTVGDTDVFAQAGGVINLVNRKSRVRFQINIGAGHDSGLHISSQLLRLAETVYGRQVGDD